MEQIFHPNKDIHVPLFTARIWHNVKNILQRNLNTVIKYYHDAPQVVKGDHFLVRLIHTMGVSYKLDPVRYYDLVTNNTMALSRAMRFTSPVSPGRLRTDYLLNNGSYEIIIGSDEPFNPIDAANNWRDLQPLTFIRHPCSDLSFILPDGKPNSSEVGFVIAKVNIPMLGIQYRGWLMEQEEISKRTGEGMLTVMHFIHQYVLPNSMYTFMDLAILNRFHNLVLGKPMGYGARKNPFTLINCERDVNTAQRNILDELLKNKMTMQSLMRNIMLVSEKNMFKIVGLPDLAPTQQITWAFALARFPMLDLLFRLTMQGNGNAQQMEINELLKFIKSMNNNNRLKNYLPQDAFYDAQFEMNDLEQLAKQQ